MRLIEGRDLWDIPNIENDSRDLHSLVMLSVHDGPFNRSFVRLCQRIWGEAQPQLFSSLRSLRSLRLEALEPRGT